VVAVRIRPTHGNRASKEPHIAFKPYMAATSFRPHRQHGTNQDSQVHHGHRRKANFHKHGADLAAIREQNERVAASPDLEGTRDSHFTLPNVLVYTARHYDEVMLNRVFHQPEHSDARESEPVSRDLELHRKVKAK